MNRSLRSLVEFGRPVVLCALLMGIVSVVPAAAQEKQPPAKAGSNDGQADLDRASERHVNARSLRDLEEVIALCERALRKGLDQDNTALAHQLAASCLFQRGVGIAGAIVEQQRPSPRWPQLREIALNDLEKAVEHNPDLAQAYEMICKLTLLPEGDREQGRRAATELIRLSAEDPAGRAAAYIFRARLQDESAARLADLQSATEADPTNVEAWQLRAAVLFESGEYQQAADAFRKLVDEQPENPTLHLALAEALANVEGQFDEAMKQIDRAIDLDPESTQGYLLRARLHASREEVDAALADLNEALQLDEDDLTALLLRAELLLFRDDFAAAREDVERAIRARPGLVLAILLRSRISAAEKKFDEAIRDMEVLIENDPNNTDYKLQIAAYHAADDRPRKAIQLITQVLEQEPENWRAMRSRADALLSIGKHAEAIEDYNKALKLAPEDSSILNNLAWVLATSPEDSLRDGQRSIELAKQACELTEYKEAHILSTLASGYAETGDFENARQWSAKAVELGEGEVKDQLKKELESYQQEKPWREKQDTKEKVDLPKRDLLET